MKKAMETHNDICLALLCVRATPIDWELPSPGELLQGRKFRSNLPAKISNKNARKENVNNRLIHRQEQQKMYICIISINPWMYACMQNSVASHLKAKFFGSVYAYDFKITYI